MGRMRYAKCEMGRICITRASRFPLLIHIHSFIHGSKVGTGE
jgi:hypothetical protein